MIKTRHMLYSIYHSYQLEHETSLIVQLGFSFAAASKVGKTRISEALLPDHEGKFVQNNISCI